MADTIKLKVESATEADVFEYKKLVEEKMAAVEEKVDNIREDLNLDNFLTKEDVADYALKTELPDISVKQDVISDLEEIRLGASLGKTSIQEHQDLTGYAKLEDIPAPPDLSSYVTDTDLENALSTLDLSSKQDKLTEEQLANINEDHSKYLTEHQSLDGYAKLTDIPAPQDLSGYALKTEIPVVPENISAFNNDAGYLTEHQDISGKQDVIADLAEIRAGAALGKTSIQAHQDLSDYALKTELPDISVKQDKLSEAQLANINADHSKYLTEHQSLDGYAKLEDIPAPQDLSSYALKSEIPTIPDHSIYALKTEIPDVSTKADSSNVYTKTEIDTMLGDMDSVLTALGV